MNNLINYTFNNLMVRTVTKDKDIYFLAKDICDILGFKNSRDAIATHVDTEDVAKLDTLTKGGKQAMCYVNESGVYALIFGSKLPVAKEFKHWVTSEVLPSIRKTGGYHVPQTFSEALIAYAKEVELREKLEKENKIMLPKAEFYDTVANSESYLSMNDVAKILNMGVGRNTLFKILRQEKVLMKDNQPYQEYVDRGYFKVIEGRYMAGDNAVITKTTYVQQKGVDYIRKLLKSRNVEYK